MSLELLTTQDRKILLLDENGNQIGEDKLDQDIIIENDKISINLIHNVLEAERWNRRQGTRKTKTRSEVRGGGKKPYRQKGTGYARQGSIRAPQFRGGATVFGPQPQDFYKKINPKMRKLAFKQLLNIKSAQNALYKIKGFKLETFSTKTVYNTLKNANLLPANLITLVYNDDEPYLYKSANNIALLKLVSGKRPTFPEMYYNSVLLFTEKGFEDFINIIKN
ncbi:MAG: 50S ribosomal protein L4 [Leptospiraceae bacterium]|nr:MAG: 50S ribosomal protein L4 [Leptospiraceae bacterium]